MDPLKTVFGFPQEDFRESKCLVAKAIIFCDLITAENRNDRKKFVFQWGIRNILFSGSEQWGLGLDVDSYRWKVCHPRNSTVVLVETTEAVPSARRRFRQQERSKGVLSLWLPKIWKGN